MIENVHKNQYDKNSSIKMHMLWEKGDVFFEKSRKTNVNNHGGDGNGIVWFVRT